MAVGTQRAASGLPGMLGSTRSAERNSSLRLSYAAFMAQLLVFRFDAEMQAVSHGQ